MQNKVKANGYTVNNTYLQNLLLDTVNTNAGLLVSQLSLSL